MFAIQLINKTGGSRTIIGETIDGCKMQAKSVADRFSGFYLAATVPYPIYKASNLFDATIPFEIRKSLGLEMRLVLLDVIRNV